MSMLEIVTLYLFLLCEPSLPQCVLSVRVSVQYLISTFFVFALGLTVAHSILGHLYGIMGGIHLTKLMTSRDVMALGGCEWIGL